MSDRAPWPCERCGVYPEAGACDECSLRVATAARAVIAAWDADVGGHALRCSSALVDAVAKLREATR